MNLKQRLLGGAMLTALAGTTAYFCSNNDEKIEYDFTISSEMNSIEEPTINRDSKLKSHIIIPHSPQTQDEEINEIGKSKAKAESLDERVKRMSNLFEEKYEPYATIQRHYEPQPTDPGGKIITPKGKELPYRLKDDTIHLKFPPSDLTLSFEVNYDIFNNSPVNIQVYSWCIEDLKEPALVIQKRKDYVILGNRNGYDSNDMKPLKKIGYLEDLRGFTIWREIVRDIVQLHPDYFEKVISKRF